MLLTVAGERADMESTAFPSKADSYIYFIIIIFDESTFQYYRQIEPCAFQLISCFDEKRLRGRSRRGTFLFDSWIVNHINLLSYRHTGVWG